MRARIKEKQEVAKGTLLVTFDLLGEDADFKPGQYFFVTLPDVGHQDDKGLRRHITVVTSPNEKGVLGFATRMRDSAFKRSLGELPVGTEVKSSRQRGALPFLKTPRGRSSLSPAGSGSPSFGACSATSVRSDCPIG